MNETPVWAEVVRLAARGDGVTSDGRFLPGVVPGDRISPDGRVEKGPHHATPPCAHFGACGGCQMQHVSDAAYAGFIEDRILWALRGVGLAPRDLLPVAMSPPCSRRRAAFRAVRRGKSVHIGFNAEGSHSLVDLAECHTVTPEIFALLAPLRRMLDPFLGARNAIGITLTQTESGMDVLLANVAADALSAIERLTEFAEAYGIARLSIEGQGGLETIVERAQPTLTMGGVVVTLPPAAFLQASREGEGTLVAAVREIVGPAHTVADLFSGLGTFALPLSQRARVLAADAAGPALVSLSAAARQAGRRIDTQHRDLFRKPLIASELRPFDAVVFDPPRAGASAQVKEIAASAVPTIAAVSCNPSTFARDAERLVNGGYALGRIWPVAQFRWSTHVELVAEFRR
jgi:23S rRNA (uracil1939-C5)-methyltransferase